MVYFLGLAEYKKALHSLGKGRRIQKTPATPIHHCSFCLAENIINCPPLSSYHLLTEPSEANTQTDND